MVLVLLAGTVRVVDTRWMLFVLLPPLFHVLAPLIDT